ncbi:hypothetical protein C8Q73DRAFT_794587 [Cubamyces lactineus]|nr:hypothetical protein C8Q73DRAFT_794587 [Cubamyces lactineus]
MPVRLALKRTHYMTVQRVLGGDCRASGPADFDRFVEVLILIGFTSLHADAEEIHLGPPLDLAAHHDGVLRLCRPSTDDGWWPNETIFAADALSAYGVTYDSVMELDDNVEVEFLIIPDL